MNLRDVKGEPRYPEIYFAGSFHYLDSRARNVYNISPGEKQLQTIKPSWLRKKIDIAELAELKRRLHAGSLRTICEDALCPNISECFGKRQATFLILGGLCTRACKFCNVSKGKPLPPDPEEPQNVAQAVRDLGLRHAVVTSPTRDDLDDGGAAHYARTVESIRSLNPGTRIELLVSDFAGNWDALRVVLDAKPDILGHNIETVERLYAIRAGADYRRSLELLARSRTEAPDVPTKSGLMLGLGLRLALTDRAGFSLGYDYELGSQFARHTLNTTLRWTW